MDYDTIALTKLKEEEMRLRQQYHARGPRPANRSDDSTDTDDREQLVYRRTRQPGALHQGARLNEESAAGSRPLFSICRRRVDGLPPQAHYHINANDLVARRWHGDCTNRNVITASTNARADIVRWPVAECAQVSMQVWPMATSRSHF